MDEALCFGWIDGVRKRVDAETYSIRFTPRNTGSLWSTVNIRRAEELVSRGRMKPAGLRAFEARRARDQRPEAAPALDPALEATLRGNRNASAFFDAQPAGYRKLVTSWVMSAKKEGTRARRLAHLIGHSERGTRLDPLRPND
ncbi:MAG TPA: YdeI/OmpD-associated family protein [Bryobacteraceae bacterium]|nr:YdeI/OmpD-associated family protein [Bryobacteraceae bacterium]